MVFSFIKTNGLKVCFVEVNDRTLCAPHNMSSIRHRNNFLFKKIRQLHIKFHDTENYFFSRKISFVHRSAIFHIVRNAFRVVKNGRDQAFARPWFRSNGRRELPLAALNFAPGNISGIDLAKACCEAAH
jgi:hypothetical protein